VEAYAEHENLSRAEAIRRLIDQGLSLELEMVS
jgi:hypothetical protein